MIALLQWKNDSWSHKLQTTARQCLQHFLAVELNNMLYLTVRLEDGIFVAIDLINTGSQNSSDRTATSLEPAAGSRGSSSLQLRMFYCRLQVALLKT